MVLRNLASRALGEDGLRKSLSLARKEELASSDEEAMTTGSLGSPCSGAAANHRRAGAHEPERRSRAATAPEAPFHVAAQAYGHLGLRRGGAVGALHPRSPRSASAQEEKQGGLWLESTNLVAGICMSHSTDGGGGRGEAQGAAGGARAASCTMGRLGQPPASQGSSPTFTGGPRALHAAAAEATSKGVVSTAGARPAEQWPPQAPV